MNSRALLTAILAIVFCVLIYPLWVPLCLGSAMGILLYPIYNYLRNRFKISDRLSALMLTIGATFLLIVPLAALFTTGIRVVLKQIRDLSLGGGGGILSLEERFLGLGWVQKILNKLAEGFHMSMPELVESIRDQVLTLGAWIANEFTFFLSKIPNHSISMVVMILAIYFVLLDGTQLLRFLKSHSVFSESQTQQIFDTFAGLARTVLLASFVSGLCQALVFLIGLVWTQVGSIPLLTLCVFFGSFLPVVGAGPITFLIVLYTWGVVGDGRSGLILLIFALVTSVIDNLARPLFLRGASNLHPFIGLIALFGGLRAFGFAGLFLGPILAGLFLEVLHAYIESRKPNSESALS